MYGSDTLTASLLVKEKSESRITPSRKVWPRSFVLPLEKTCRRSKPYWYNTEAVPSPLGDSQAWENKRPGRLMRHATNLKMRIAIPETGYCFAAFSFQSMA